MTVHPPRPPLHGLSVLLVDDNPVAQLASRACLQPLGLDVTCVDSGEAALRALEERRFDAVLMDLHMPGRDGFETTAAIRALGADRGAVPVVALTATAESEDLRRCRDATLNGCLEKPLDAGLLARLLDPLCRPDGAHRDGTWTWIEPAAPGTAGPAPAPAAGGADPTREADDGWAFPAPHDPPPHDRSALQRLEQALAEQIARHGAAHPLSRALLRAAGRLPNDAAPLLSPSGR